jgi:hypothetical protein
MRTTLGKLHRRGGRAVATSTTDPIDVRALRARLALERASRGMRPVPSLRMPASLVMPPAPTDGPNLTYTPWAWRHLIGIMIFAVLVFLATVAIATWVEMRGPDHGWARWMREPAVSVEQPAGRSGPPLPPVMR